MSWMTMKCNACNHKNVDNKFRLVTAMHCNGPLPQVTISNKPLYITRRRKTRKCQKKKKKKKKQEKAKKIS